MTRKARVLERGRRGVGDPRLAGRFERITAVIVNADGRVDGFAASDWDYRRDDQRFRVRLTG